MSKPTKKFERRADARPDEVLDAALAVFLEAGFAAAKVEDIAKRAGVSKGTVYLYFPSKEALIEAIVQRAVAPLTFTAIPDMASFSGDPRIPITMLMQMLSHLLIQPDKIAIPKLIMREVTNFPGLAEMYRRNVLDKAIPVLTALLRRGVDEGYLRPIDPELTVRSIVGPVVAHVMLSEVFGVRPADGLSMDAMVQNHLDILFNGISAKSQQVQE